MAILVQSNKKPSVSFPSQTGSIITFNSQYAGLPLKSCKVNIPVTQEGTGDPSPDNVRNFVGVDSLDFSATGKNLLNGYAFANLIYQNGTATSIDTTNKTVTFTNAKSPYNQNLTPSMRFKENTQYTFIIPYLNNGVNNCIRVQYTDESISWVYLVSSSGQKTTYVLTTDVNKTVSHLFFTFTSNAQTIIWYDEVCCLEGVKTADDFVPFGNNKLFYFGQTIYAGELDVLTGVFTATHKMVDLGTLDWFNQGSYFYQISNLGVKSSTTNWLSNCIKQRPSTTSWINMLPWEGGFGGTQFRVKDDGTSQTSADFKTRVQGFMLFYELETPELINLGGMEIATLQGENNLFASTGETTVHYIKIGG